MLGFLALTAGAAMAQNIAISGTVIDASNDEPLIGAPVALSGTTTGTTTDIDGRFKLEVPVGKKITVSYVGYETQTITIRADKSDYNIAMQINTQMLDDVVVIGYGTQKRSEFTGSITTVKGSDFKNYSVNSVADALSGRSAGVSVTKSGGTPGEAPDIIIRGAASINGMSPLYIVDGVKQGTGFSFNMNDVESIEILKDAASCAIYGSEAAGGVILITTKRGSADSRPSVNFTARYGIRKVTNPVTLMNRDQFIAAKALVGRDILAAHAVESASELPDVNWMDQLYGTGNEQEYNVSLSGGTSKLKYFASLNFNSEKGCYIDSKAERFSFRTNVDYNISSRVQTGTSIYGNYLKENPTRPNNSIYTNSIPFRTVPTMTPYDEDGNWSYSPSYISGPNLLGRELTYHYNGRTYGVNALAYLNINIIPGLDFRVNGAAKIGAYSNTQFQEIGLWGADSDNTAYLISQAGTSSELTYNATLTYDRMFGDHALKLMIGSEATKSDSYGNSVTGYNFPVNIAESLSLSTDPDKRAYDNIGVGRSMSFFGRLNYNYAGRYFLTANVRRDGSDRFAKANRWGTFPSINAAWRFSKEEFIKDAAPWLFDGKLRIGYGILGNDGIAQFLYQKAYVGNAILYNYNGTGDVQGWANFKVPNDKIKWEEVHQLDFGLDLAFLNNRLNFTYDYYNRQTRDMLYQAVVPLAGGMGYYTDYNNTMPINVGKVENYGHEFSINWIDHIADFNYSVGFNASFNTNTVKELGTEGAAPLTSADGINRTENGKSIAMLWGYKCIGIFETQEQVDEYNAKAQAAGHPYYWRQNTGVGDLIFSDVDRSSGEHQGYVDENCMDYIGNPWPKMTFGINLTAEYKGFDLSANFQGALGFDIYNGLKEYTMQFKDDNNTTMDIYKTSFFANNGLTEYPRTGYLDGSTWNADPSANYSTVSSFWVEKGNYLKLKNLVVGYTLPHNITRKAAMEKVRIYFTASNLFTITSYSGIDPEIGGTADSGTGKTSSDLKSRGVENYYRYLPSRLYAFGLDITF
jgi:TonB-linked SusC/RagA family outer membrane protein